MPILPSRGDVHVNRPLTSISIAHVQSASNFVADQVFPGVDVAAQSDLYYTIDRGDFNRDEAQERAPATESEGSGYTLNSDSQYFAKVYGFHHDVPDQVRNNQDTPLNVDRQAVIFVTTKMLLKREVVWATNYFTQGNPGDTWTFDVDGVASSPTAAASFDPTSSSSNDKLQWNDAASTPIEDIRQGKRFVLQETGFEPNTLTLGKPTYDALLDHPDIIARIDRGQTQGAARANLVTLADLFEVDRVLVMKAIRNTSKKGQTAAHSFIGGKHALLTYAPPEPGIMTPSAGYTFKWTGMYGGDTLGQRIKRYRMEHLAADRVEIEAAFDMKKVDADLGYFFGSIVA